ncbi:MAG: tRNA (guanosine(46)-N7)-methyltransferase TrmB [Candidatus Bipolaricaulota bacterium]|nr:tRNA (guanosine(46)-N7)-methyltransferase TrmB [Candidatus Bipolaricaulota bacterium]
MDAARYLVRPERWEGLPLPWGEVFGREAPLAVEIGFGNGEFLAEASVRQRDWNWVGFETSLTCVAKAGRKLALAGARHVRLALVDGRFGLRELFPDESVHQVFLHFPCPWPKRSHADRRVVEPGFVQTLAAVLVPGGGFRLVTDVFSYAEEAGEHLRGAGFRVEGPAELPEGGPGSRYEAKWRRQGRPIWALQAARGPKGSTLRIAEGAMPHVRIGRSIALEDGRRVVGLKEAWPGGAFVVKEAYGSPDGRVVLLRAFATDGGFEQQYFITVVPDGEGALVKLDGATVPFRTPAVKRSVAAVGAALEGR